MQTCCCQTARYSLPPSSGQQKHLQTENSPVQTAPWPMKIKLKKQTKKTNSVSHVSKCSIMKKFSSLMKLMYLKILAVSGLYPHGSVHLLYCKSFWIKASAK